MQGLGVVKYPAAITLPQSAPFSVITISLMSRVRALTCFIAAELVKLYTGLWQEALLPLLTFESQPCPLDTTQPSIKLSSFNGYHDKNYRLCRVRLCEW